MYVYINILIARCRNVTADALLVLKLSTYGAQVRTDFSELEKQYNQKKEVCPEPPIPQYCKLDPEPWTLTPQPSTFRA